MPTTAELQAQPFKRGTKIRLVDDITGHPAGSHGRIAVANGFDWIRYWVRFNDGSTAGHVDHGSVVKVKDYDRFLVARDLEAVEAEAAVEAAALAAESAGEEADTGAGPGAGTSDPDPVVNGVSIPQRLLDQSAAARARLGA